MLQLLLSKKTIARAAAKSKDRFWTFAVQFWFFYFKEGKMELAERIKELCEQKGMTVKELSEKSDIPLTTVKRIMSGQTPDPGYTTVIKIF